MGGTSNCFSIAPSNQDPTSSVVDSTHLTCQYARGGQKSLQTQSHGNKIHGTNSAASVCSAHKCRAGAMPQNPTAAISQPKAPHPSAPGRREIQIAVGESGDES